MAVFSSKTQKLHSAPLKRHTAAKLIFTHFQLLGYSMFLPNIFFFFSFQRHLYLLIILKGPVNIKILAFKKHDLKTKPDIPSPLRTNVGNTYVNQIKFKPKFGRPKQRQLWTFLHKKLQYIYFLYNLTFLSFSPAVPHLDFSVFHVLEKDSEGNLSGETLRTSPGEHAKTYKRHT